MWEGRWTDARADGAVRGAFFAAGLAYFRKDNPAPKYRSRQLETPVESEFPPLRYVQIQAWISRLKPIPDRTLNAALKRLTSTGELTRAGRSRAAPYVYPAPLTSEAVSADVARVGADWVGRAANLGVTWVGSGSALVYGVPRQVNGRLGPKIARRVSNARASILELFDSEADRLIRRVVRGLQGRLSEDKIVEAEDDMREVWRSAGQMHEKEFFLKRFGARIQRQMPGSLLMGAAMIEKGNLPDAPMERLDAVAAIFNLPAEFIASPLEKTRRRVASVPALRAALRPRDQTDAFDAFGQLLRARASLCILIR